MIRDLGLLGKSKQQVAKCRCHWYSLILEICTPAFPLAMPAPHALAESESENADDPSPGVFRAIRTRLHVL